MPVANVLIVDGDLAAVDRCIAAPFSIASCTSSLMGLSEKRASTPHHSNGLGARRAGMIISEVPLAKGAVPPK